MGHSRKHGTEHTDGTDDIQDATPSQKGLMTPAFASKLSNIEDGATKSTASEQVEIIFVSGTKGDDTNGDGSMFNPYATLQKAIDVITAGEGYGSIIIDSMSEDNPDITIPGIYVHLQSFLGPEDQLFIINKITITESGAYIQTDNLNIVTLDASALGGLDSADFEMENGQLQNVTNISRVRFVFRETKVQDSTFATILSGALGVDGTTIDNSGKLRSPGFDAEGQTIDNVADPTVVTQADTKGARDSAIATHASDENAHHNKLHAASHTDGTDDIATFSGPGSKGLVPDPTASAGKFLKDDGTWDIAGGTDPNAIHDNVSGEINAIAEKTDMEDDDEIIAEDSSNSWAKVKMKLSKLREYFTRRWKIDTYGYNMYGANGTFNGVSCGGAGLSSLTNLNGEFGGIYRSFNANNPEACVMTLKLPDNYTAGNDIKVDLHWCANATSGQVKWVVGVAAISMGETYRKNYTYVSSVASPDGSTSYGKVGTYITIDGSTFEPDDDLEIVVFRDAGDSSDTMNGDALLSTVGFEEADA